ncbi:MAG TPA: DUF6585 family protein [Urbifossiella sp.]|nr:DUF6585 family protein [Urbifossiella sp.]
MPELPAEARLAPWATDDALVSAHRWSALRWLASFASFWGAFGFWAALNVSVLVKPPPHLTPPKIAALTAGILALVLALFGFVLYGAAWRFRRRTRAFYVFPEGFVYQTTAGDWGGCRWADVTEVWRAETMHHGVTTRSYVRVVTADADLLLDRSLNGYAKLADDVEARVARATLPDLLDRYRRGERLAFGPLELDTEGVTLRGREVPWAEVKEFRLVNGSLLMVGPPVDPWRGNGAAYRDVPNLAALLAILNVPPWASLKPA